MAIYFFPVALVRDAQHPQVGGGKYVDRRISHNAIRLRNGNALITAAHSEDFSVWPYRALWENRPSQKGARDGSREKPSFNAVCGGNVDSFVSRGGGATENYFQSPRCLGRYLLS